MKKKPERFMSMPLWQKGLFLIGCGVGVNLVMGFVFPIVGNSEAARGQRLESIAGVAMSGISAETIVPSAAKTTMFDNPTRNATRYAVVVATEPRKKR